VTDPLAELHAHLERHPAAPLPGPLRLALLAELSRGRRAQRLALADLARHLDPDGRLSRWRAAGRVLEVLAGHDRLGRIARGLRAPASATERLCAAVVRAGPLPTSRRTVYRALTADCQNSRGQMLETTTTQDDRHVC
jgi:hypothetical protein